MASIPYGYPVILVWVALLSLTHLNALGSNPKKWTIGIEGNSNDANQVAREYGCKNLGLVNGFNDVYLFEKLPNSGKKKSTMNEHQALRFKRRLESHPRVAWVDPQIPQIRVKRDFFNLGLLSQGIPAALNRMLQKPASIVEVPVSPVAQVVHQQPSSSPSQPPQSMPSGYDQSQAIGIPSSAITINSGNSNPNNKNMNNNNQQQQLTNDFNDELWNHQWYLQESANVAKYQNGIELHVDEVWKMGFYGRGVIVTILDDGLEWNHTDILPNYDARASWDMNNNRSDPFPRYDSYDSNNHGTRCAGEVAMVANNRKCGVGVAPRARIGGIKCLDGAIMNTQTLDHIESMSLLHNLDHIDIYSGSWGPQDNGKTVEGPKRLATQAFERGIKYGRKGKGALYVWANGNGGISGDNCNCDGYINSIYTIAIGGVTQQGQFPIYGERCSSTLAVTCSSGALTDGKAVTTDLHNKCTIDFTGTSAAAPLAAGVYALVLEANSNLTWRDVQHLTVWTSDPYPIRDNMGWKQNGAGLMFNSRFGFGLMNAKAMVDAAIGWQTVPQKSICINGPSRRLPVFLQSRNMVQVTFVSDGCLRDYEHQVQQQHTSLMRPGSSNSALRSVPKGGPVNYLEHVQVVVDIEYTNRGSLDIFLISPAGTISTLLTRRPLDSTREGFDKWHLMSVHFWGETSQGTWTLIVRDKNSSNNRGLLRNATLILHGTGLKPAHMNGLRFGEDEQMNNYVDPVSELDEEDIYDLNQFPNDFSLVKDDTHQPTLLLSVIAKELYNQKQ